MRIKPAKRPGKVVMEVGDRDSDRLSQPATASPLKVTKILVPIDFSALSEHAVNTAAGLAEQSRAEIILFHVVPLPVVCSIDSPPDAYAMMDEASYALEKMALKIPADVSWEKIVRLGTREPIQEIVEEAGKIPADLIVIATHGYSALKRMLLGSTAEKVVRCAPCPVLVVHEHEESLVDTAQSGRSSIPRAGRTPGIKNEAKRPPPSTVPIL
jgi:nucleotide-binding universal stress UspA family protein